MKLFEDARIARATGDLMLDGRLFQVVRAEMQKARLPVQMTSSK